MYNFIACSHKLGTIKVKSSIDNEYIITMYGSWIPEGEAEEFVNRTYPVYCTVTKAFEHKHAVFYVTPTQDQLKMKPQED